MTTEERLAKAEADLVKINEIIFAHGAPLGSGAYFQIREIASKYERSSKPLAKFAERDRVRIITPKPLPSGRTVRLVALVDHIREDGAIAVRVCTPGIYGGGILIVHANDIEKV